MFQMIIWVLRDGVHTRIATLIGMGADKPFNTPTYPTQHLYPSISSSLHRVINNSDTLQKYLAWRTQMTNNYNHPTVVITMVC